MNDTLERFKKAQAATEGGFDTAIAELRSGRKTSHWIWYVFPQLAELGRSSTAIFYGIRDFGEACDYLRDPLLRRNLSAVTEAVVEQVAKGTPLITLMGGSTDSQKLVSCLTLFEAAALRVAPEDGAGECTRLAQNAAQVLSAARQQGLSPCAITEERIGD